MAKLPDEDRRRIWAHLMRRGQFPGDISKSDLRAAVDAIDTWVEDNTASFNTALPTTYRTSADADQKAALLMYVVMRRSGKLRTEED